MNPRLSLHAGAFAVATLLLALLGAWLLFGRGAVPIQTDPFGSAPSASTAVGTASNAHHDDTRPMTSISCEKTLADSTALHLSLTMARDKTIPAQPPSACTKRAAISHSRLGAKAQARFGCHHKRIKRRCDRCVQSFGCHAHVKTPPDQCAAHQTQALPILPQAGHGVLRTGC